MVCVNLFVILPSPQGKTLEYYFQIGYKHILNVKCYPLAVIHYILLVSWKFYREYGCTISLGNQRIIWRNIGVKMIPMDMRSKA
jgi:hypothetical protein